MSSYLAERVQLAFDRCKEFPEAGARGGYFMVRGDAYLALIELRNLAPEIVLALQRGEKNPQQVADRGEADRTSR